ncbi:MAG: branched-chain amino acid ABC transporter substrate-binding protein, partial [Desulfobacteraceae bacterium]|nr:branched-chain amino acid ABC transporter substrate-binding protein [Desulfobacteraceae bacterium]
LKIRNALAETKDFKGISGTITFDEKGDPINRDAVIRKFENGRIIFHKTFRP